MNELKCCPFCGGEADIQCVPTFEGIYYYGLCLKCKVHTRYRATESEAATDWNTRHGCKCNTDDMWTHVCGYKE